MKLYRTTHHGNLVRLRVSNDSGQLVRYAPAATVEQVEARIIAGLGASLAKRYLQVKKSKVGGDGVIVGRSLLYPDGSPHYLGLLHLPDRPATYIRLVIGQQSGRQPICRKFNLAKHPSCQAAFLAACDALGVMLALSPRQLATITASWPAFYMKHSLASIEGLPPLE